jgi:cyclophilin family peptidyl-prolyl cis-trans isomerase
MALTQTAIAIIAFFSVLLPSKSWYKNDEPILITNAADHAVILTLTDFVGRRQQAQEQVKIEAGQQVDLLKFYAPLRVGTYVLAASKPDSNPGEFVGTPLVISLIPDERAGADANKPMVVRIVPLTGAVIETSLGTMTAAFYFDEAPNTAISFLQLAQQGFYDGIAFHRVVPGFVVQAGDPLGDGTGGPGFRIDAEFNSRPHTKGVLSMARQGDPMERAGAMPRPEFADSASSQFFICLDYTRTNRLDGKYTTFGMIVDGLPTIDQLGSVKIANPETGAPETPPVIKTIRVLPVTPEFNPYIKLIEQLSTPAVKPGQ